MSTAHDADAMLDVGASLSVAPLFLVSEIVGDTFPHFDLLRNLQIDIPIHRLVIDESSGVRLIEELAANYREIMQRVQPKGPYRVAGYSFGAIVAYEIAAQLVGNDEEVEFLGLIDAPCPDAGGEWGKLSELEVLRLYLESMHTLAPEQRTVLDRSMDIEQALVQCKTLGLVPEEFTICQIEAWVTGFNAIRAIALEYQFLPIPVSSYLFIVGEAARERTLHWKSIVGERLHIEVIGRADAHIWQQQMLESLARAISRVLRPTDRHVHRSIEQEYNAAVLLQTGRPSSPPIFCFPGAGASVACFLGFVEAIGEQTTVYGIQPRGLDGIAVPHARVELAAANGIRAIKRTWPGGPYRLLGHSFGGWIAFEVACQLKAMGADLDAVVLLDTETPTLSRAATRLRGYEIFEKLIRLLEQESNRKIPLTGTDFKRKVYAEQLNLLLQAMIGADLLPRSSTATILRGMVRVFAANVNTAYRPSVRFQGRLLLVRPQDSAGGASGAVKPDCGHRERSWEDLVDRFESIEVSGNHMRMLRSNNLGLAIESIRRHWSVGA